jgi:hypothetical protein
LARALSREPGAQDPLQGRHSARARHVAVEPQDDVRRRGRISAGLP